MVKKLDAIEIDELRNLAWRVTLRPLTVRAKPARMPICTLARAFPLLYAMPRSSLRCISARPQ